MELSIKRKTKSSITKVVLYLVMVLVAVFMVLPFYWSAITSIRNNNEIFNMKWWSSDISLEHYKRVFEVVPIARMFGNSIFVTLVGLFTNLFFGSLAAYAFAKIRFTGHKVVFNIMLSSLMIPGCIVLIPQYLVMSHFPLAGGNDILGQGGIGLVDSLWAVILPGAIGVYGVFFMRQFFVSLSDDMAEAARIDGASEFRIFWQIYLPLIKPALMTLGIFTFQGGWNNFLWPSIVLSSEETQVLTMAFIPFKGSRSIEYGPLMAVSILMALPVIVLFLCAQKYFISGVAVGGSKE